jgi:7-keto-8-aminopelargonate synthetase-like enzyme
LQSPFGAELVIDGRRYINFAGSSYLGLSGLAQILEAGLRTLRDTGAGYQLSRQFDVVSAALEDVEREGALFFDSESACFLSSGYHFGFASLAVLRDRFSIIFFDEQAHYCLREAIAASGVPSHAFRHLQAEHLAELCKRHCGAGAAPLVATDGMYSTLGEIAPLAALAQVVEPYAGRLLVDESHSFGVLGEHGRGASEQHELAGPAVFMGGSLSKAFGAAGALIPATREEMSALLTTAVSRGAGVGLPACAAMCAESLRYVRAHPERLQCLRHNTAYLKTRLRELGLDVGATVAPVAAFRLESRQTMAALQQRLMSEGIFVLHSDYIGAGVAGVIRCGIFADHTQAHMDQLVDWLRRLL